MTHVINGINLKVLFFLIFPVAIGYNV